MRTMRITALLTIFLLAAACGTLDKKALLINHGESKEQVLKIMGPPDDRQFKEKNEAWQYCVTGAGFGYHDYRIFWFYDGKVTGVNSYKSSRPASSCVTDIKPVNWEEAPDVTKKKKKK